MISKNIKRVIDNAYRSYPKMQGVAATKIADYHYEYGMRAKSGAAKGTVVEERIAGILDSRPYRWCEVIEMVIEHYKGSGKDKLIYFKYFHAPKMSDCEIWVKMNISKATLYNWLEDIITYTHKCAIYKRLLEPEM